MPSAIELIEASTRGTGVIQFEPSGEQKSVKQIWDSSEQVARWIAARVGTGTAVAAFLSNTPPCPAVIFGIWRSGNTLVSLPYPGRGTNMELYLGQLDTMCELAGAELVLIDADYRGLLPSFPRALNTFQEATSGGPRCDADRSGGVIQFTSGSIGAPKGVVLSGEAIAANMLSIIQAAEVDPGDTACSWLPLSHDMGFVGMFLTTVAAAAPEYGGSTLVLQTPESFLANPASWLKNCSDIGAVLTTAPNFAFDLAVRTKQSLPGIDLSRMRICITGAERVSGPTLARFTDTFADAGLSPLALCPAYGMAEAALAITMVRPRERFAELHLDPAALGAGTATAAVGGSTVDYVGNGTAVPGMEVRIAGDTGGSAAAGGATVGEVQVRGPSMLSRYVGADLRLTADGWFPTRDVGFVSDGSLYLVGRSDETIIIGGRNYYSADIETVVTHPQVRPGCLAAIPLTEGGYGLVAEPAATDTDAGAMRQACRELAVLAARESGARPALVGFIPRGQMPKTPSGKVQRLRLGAALRNGEVELTASISSEGASL